MKPLIQAGKVYIALSPLYKTLSKGKYYYLNTKEDLDQFIVNQLMGCAVVDSNGNELSEKKKEKYVQTSLKYNEVLESIGSDFSIDPKLLELVLVKNFDENSKLNLSKYNKLEVTKDKSDILSISGFFKEDEEYFIYTSFEKSKLFPKLEKAKKLYNKLEGYNYCLTKNKPVVTGSYYGNNKHTLDTLTFALQISRLKGLGEANADELWDTTLNPETRRLIQINIDNVEDSENVVQKFMNQGKSDGRKEFLKEVFDTLVTEVV